MVGVPRYLSHQDFQPIQQATSAPVLDAISEKFDKIGQSIGTQAAVQEGLKAGEKPGFQPLPDLTRNTAAFNEAALQTNKIMANNQASEHLAKLKQDADAQFADPTTAAKFYNNNADSYLKSFMQHVPAQNKPYLQASLSHQRLVTNADFNTRIQKQKNTDAFVSYVGNQQQNFDAMTASLHEGDMGVPGENATGAGEQYYQQIVKSGELALGSGIITKTQFQELTNKAQTSYNSGLFMHGAQTALKDSPQSFAKYINSANQNGISGLSDKQSRTLINQARTMASSHILGGAIDSTVINKNYNQNLKNALQTGSFSQSEVNQYIVTHPEKEQEATDQLQTNQMIHSDAVRIASQNMLVQNKMINNVKGNYSSSDFVALNNVIKSKNKELENKPFEFYSKNPAVLDSIFQDKNLNVALQNMGVNISPDQLQHSNPSEKIVIAQELRGTARNKIWATTRADALNSVLLVENGSLQQVQQKFDQERNRLGPDFPLYINNLRTAAKEQGVSLDGSLIFASTLSPSNPQSANIFNALKTPLSVLESSNNVTSSQRSVLNNSISSLFQEQPNLSGESGHGLMGDYIQMVRNSSSTTGQAKHLSDVQKYLRHVSLYYVSRGQDVPTAMENAESLFVSRLNFVNQRSETVARETAGGLSGFISRSLEGTGPIIAIPKVVDGNPVAPNVITSYLLKSQKLVRNFNFTVPPDIKPNLGKSARSSYYYNNNLKAGHWVTNSAFTGYLWADNVGRIMTNASGKPLEISNSDAANNTDISTLLPGTKSARAAVKKLLKSEENNG